MFVVFMLGYMFPLITASEKAAKQGEVSALLETAGKLVMLNYFAAGRFQAGGVTLPETNSEFTPENGWLEYQFPFGMAYFQGRTVSFLEGTVCFSLKSIESWRIWWPMP